MVLSGEPEPRYTSRAEIKERLAEEQANPEILAGVLFAIDRYDPKWQAVLLVETPESCTASIVGFNRSENVASVSFTTAR